MSKGEDGFQASKRGVLRRQYKYYEVLSINRKATIEEIKKAYRKQVKIYHPDVSTDPEAVEKIKLINRAYQVLVNPKSRDDYDASPAECPSCYTHEVIQAIELLYRCRSCGCKFDASRPLDIIETVERAAIPEKRRAAIRVFQTTQCSWCNKFYTSEPFLCPSGRLQSNCLSFQKLDPSERKRLLGEEKWWWRMSDMLQAVEDRGIMAKCRYCFALNPNPQKTDCWQCGKDGLRCPGCEAKPFLRYSFETNRWKCPNAAHSKTYAYVPKVKDTRYVLSDEICPNCKKNLYWDTELWLYKCRGDGCKRTYTFEDLHKGQKAPQVAKEKTVVKKKLKTHYHVRWLIVLIAFLAIVMFGIIIWATIGNQILQRLRITFF